MLLLIGKFMLKQQFRGTLLGSRKLNRGKPSSHCGEVGYFLEVPHRRVTCFSFESTSKRH